jgi:hypothetical protein
MGHGRVKIMAIHAHKMHIARTIKAVKQLGKTQ